MEVKVDFPTVVPFLKWESVMKKVPCSCCESSVVGVLVFHTQPGVISTVGQRKVVADVFTSAIAFIEEEEWAVTGKYTIKGERHESLQDPRG